MTHWEQGPRRWDGRDAPRSVPPASGAGRPAMRLDDALAELYDEAMARFDAFCFWYARPPRTRPGMREIAKRLEAYGSPEALRIAEEVRAALEEA